MIDHVREILLGQFEASLCMLNECMEKCPQEHWDGKIAKYTFWQVAYHTLCFVDLYLSPSVESFQRRDLHPQGWSEPGSSWSRFKEEYPSRRFDKRELTEYLAICRQKGIETLASETPESLEHVSGFQWLPFSRGEVHLYNIRHIQHHTGQLSAFLRKVDEALQDPKAVRWISTGWR